MQEKHSDRRVRKSKEALREALLRLIPQKGYDAIRIQDIADEADTARVTFYRHYKDKDELLLDALEQVYLQLIAQFEVIPPEERMKNPPVALFYRYIQENEALCRVLFGHHGALMVVSHIRNYFANLIMVMVDQHTKEEDRLLPLAVMAQSAASAHVGLAIWWLENDFPYTPEEMAQASRWLIVNGQGAAMQRDMLPLPPPDLRSRSE